MTATGTENVVKVEHAAAAVLREAPSVRADVAALQTVRATEGAKTMFVREAVPDEGKKEPNFPEIDSTIHKISDPVRQAELINMEKRLQEIIEGRPPAAGAPGGADAHFKLIGEIASDMPGMVAAISKETGLTAAVVKTRLKGALTGMRPILTRLLQDKAFIGQLAGNVARLEYTEDMVDMDSRYDALNTKVTNTQSDIDTRRKVYTNPGAVPPGAREWYASLAPGTQAGLQSDIKTYRQAMTALNNSALDESFRRSAIAPGEIVNYQNDIDTELGTLSGGLTYAALTAAGFNLEGQVATVLPAATYNAASRIERANKIRALIKTRQAADRINAIYTANPNFDNDMAKFQQYQESADKLRGIQAEQDTLDTEKASLAKLKIQRDKKLNEYGNKVGSALNRSFREYYNDVLLKEAETIAEMDANKKAEDKKKAEDLKAKREEDAKTLLSKFLRLAYLRYQGGRVVGWDDDAIKHFVKQDLLASSPAQMARKLLERVQGYRGNLPPTYQAEINKILTDMGVGAGPPPVTFANVLDAMDSSFMSNLAGTEMPKVLGYAYARGYYFDKLRMTKSQAEFLRTAYSTDFFTQALGSKQEYIQQLEAEFGKGILQGELGDQIKQILVGKDWEQGMKKLFKAAAVGGLGVAGLSFIGGAQGLAGGVETVKGLGRAGAAVVSAASAATTEGLRLAGQGIGHAALTAEHAVTGSTQAIAAAAKTAIDPNNAAAGAITNAFKR